MLQSWKQWCFRPGPQVTRESHARPAINCRLDVERLEDRALFATLAPLEPAPLETTDDASSTAADPPPPPAPTADPPIPGSIAGYIWRDMNGDGLYQPVETPGGTMIELLDAQTMRVLATFDSGPTLGYYEFVPPAAESYLVRVTPERRLILTSKDSGPEEFDSDVDPVSQLSDRISRDAVARGVRINAGLSLRQPSSQGVTVSPNFLERFIPRRDERQPPPNFAPPFVPPLFGLDSNTGDLETIFLALDRLEPIDGKVVAHRVLVIGVTTQNEEQISQLVRGLAPGRYRILLVGHFGERMVWEGDLTGDGQQTNNPAAGVWKAVSRWADPLRHQRERLPGAERPRAGDRPPLVAPDEADRTRATETTSESGRREGESSREARPTGERGATGAGPTTSARDASAVAVELATHSVASGLRPSDMAGLAWSISIWEVQSHLAIALSTEPLLWSRRSFGDLNLPDWMIRISPSYPTDPRLTPFTALLSVDMGTGDPESSR